MWLHITTATDDHSESVAIVGLRARRTTASSAVPSVRTTLIVSATTGYELDTQRLSV